MWPRASCYFLPLAYILTGNWLRKASFYKSGFIPGLKFDFLYTGVSGGYFRAMIPHMRMARDAWTISSLEQSAYMIGGAQLFHSERPAIAVADI